MDVIKKLYDKNYFENILYKEIPNSQRNKNRLNEILKYKQTGKLLEIGCSKGEFLKLAQKNFIVEGMDTSNYAISEASKALSQKVFLTDIEKQTLSEENYDIIVAFNLLEHLKDPSQTIKKIYLALKPGGILIGSVPNNFGLIGKAFTKFTNFLDKTHCSTLKPQQWNKIFKNEGFYKIKFFGEILINRNKCFYVKKSFWKHASLNLVFLCEKK